MPSVRSRLLIAYLRIARRKQTFLDTVKFDQSIRRSQRAKTGPPPKQVRRRHRVEYFEVHGFDCYSIEPSDGAGDTQVLYLHGGAYVHSAETEHWTFAGKLVEALGCRVVLPLYPLAPGYQYDETLSMVRAVYDRCIADASDRVVMGDSAGGALAVTLARGLRDEGGPVPANLVLISPWLDITMADPAVPILDQRDPYLSTPGLLEAGSLYAGELDPHDERVSPIYGRFDGLGRISVFVGTRDVLLRDSRRLRDIAENHGLPIDYHEYRDMIHGWVLMPLPEGRQARHQIYDILRGAG